MTPKAYVSVSMKGDRPYVGILGMLAKSKGKRIGDLVRDAVEEKYGDELTKIQSAFSVVQNGNDCNHSDTIGSITGAA